MRWAQNVVMLLTLGCILPRGLDAQMTWQRMTASISTGFAPVCIVAEDGVVVVGGNGLAISSNEGSTWQMLAIPVQTPNITRLAIYDRNNFAFQSGTNQIYITHDGGNTWKTLLDNASVTPTFPMVFMGDPKRVLCMSTTNSFIYTSNGGSTYTATSNSSLNPYQFKLAANGTLRLFSRTDSNVVTAYSADTGKTWTSTAVLRFRDCFSLIADPLSANTICLINEDYWVRQDRSKIFWSSNNGTTWDTTFTHTLEYLAGSSDVGCTDYFASTVNDGVLRSTDQGRNWHRIGGPSVYPDFHNLVAADDSLLFAIDTNFAIWATRPLSHTWKIKVRNLLEFTNSTIVSCDSLITGKVIVYSACSGIGVAYANITGPDANAYEFLDSADASFPDTIEIRFHPPTAGSTTDARLKFTLDDSTKYEYDLSVTTVLPEIEVRPQELMVDTVIYCEMLTDTIRVKTLCPITIENIQILGLDSLAFTLIGTTTRSLPQDSLIVFRFTPTRLGAHNALVRITTQHGRVHHISLRPFATTAPLAVVFDTAFARDTLWTCQTGRDTVRLRSICTLDNVLVSLTDSTDYRILTKRNLSLPQDSVIVIEYSFNGTSNINSYLTLRSPYLDTVNVPLRRSFKRAPVILDIQPKIAQDTFSFCKEVIDTLIFRSLCPHIASKFRFEGPDASKFKVLSSTPLQLPADSAMVISCSTNQPGQLNADLVFETEDGHTNRYRLMPVFITSPFKFKPSSLFAGDSVGSCVGSYDTLRISSDCPLLVKSISISGADAAAFTLLNAGLYQLPTDSLVIVHCLPGPKGRKIAALRIELEDGRTWSVPLSALIVDAPIKIVPAALFVRDSISSCLYGLDTLRLIAPCKLDLKSVTIQGPDAALFQIEGSIPSSLPNDSIVIVRCIPTRKGGLAATLRIEASDGRVWIVPLTPYSVQSLLRFSKNVLFEQDTLLTCSTLKDTLSLNADCPLDLTSITIAGPDASAFVLNTAASFSLPQDSFVIVTCSPSRSGRHDATLHIVSTDGRSWDISLSSVASTASVTLSTNRLFVNDTITVCTTVTDTLQLSSACPFDIDVSVTGIAANAFTLSTTQLRYPIDSVLTVRCDPGQLGQVDATLHLLASDGRAWDIPMSVYSYSSPLAFSPAILFDRDSFNICDRWNDTVYIRTVCPAVISNINIVGTDRQAFNLLKSATSLPEDSIVIVECTPTHSGVLNASLNVEMSDGRSVSVPLVAYANEYSTLQLAPLLNVSTDTLGGDVSLPIRSLRTGGRGVVEFTLHYDNASLVLDGVFDTDGVDRSNGRDGSSRVIFNSDGETSLYAQFTFLPVDQPCATIRIDSITESGGKTDCLLKLTNDLTASVCMVDFCGRPLLSGFLRYGEIPNFVVTPNPSTGDVVLHTDMIINNALIEVIDGFGVTRQVYRNIDLTQRGKILETNGLASGLYEVRVTNNIYHATTRWILTR